MKILIKLLHFTLTYKFINNFISIYNYIIYYTYISDTLYSDEFKHVLKRYLNVDVDRDWIGRLYGVINPNIDIDGKFNVNTMIIEIDGDNTNNNEQVKNWCYKQLALIFQLFNIHNLGDYIDLTFRHVGPREADNYLLIFDIVSRKLFAYSVRSFMLQLFIYCCIAAIILFIVL